MIRTRTAAVHMTSTTTSRPNRRSRRLPPGALVLALLVFLGGCGDPGGRPEPAPQPTPTPAPETRISTEPEGETEIPLPQEILAEASARVSAADGATLDLPDGFALDLPPGALTRDAPVKVTKVRIEATNTGLLEDLVCYRLEAGEGHGAALSGDAKVKLPLPEGVAAEDVCIIHYLEDGGAEVLPHSPADADRVAVSLRSFSWLRVAAVGAALWKLSPYADRLEAAEEVIRNTNEKRILPVPFYSQSDYAWCWATSAAMVFGAQGAKIQPQEIAALFDAERSQGGSFWPRVFGNSFDFRTIAAGAGLPALPMRMHAFGGVWEKSLRGWIIQQIRAGKPVWVGLRKYDAKGGDHAIVVVGYDHVGFYLHDPSGALLAQLEVNRGKAAKKSEAKVDEAAFANVRVPYGEWRDLMAPGMFQYRPWLTNIGLVDVPVGDARTVSLQIRPGTQSAGLLFHRDGFTFATLSESKLYWNGQRPLGAGFSRHYAYPDKPAEARRLGASFLSNSDALSLLRVLLHDTSESGFRGSLRVSLDGIAIGTGTAVEASVAGGTTNQEVTVAEDPGIASFRDPKVADYVPVEARTALTLTDALNFMARPLALGRHTLTIALLNGAGEVVDRVRIPFEMHPAVPRAVSVENVTREIGGKDAVVHRITWEPSPEEARLHALGRKGRYRVYRVAQMDAGLNDPEPVATIEARSIARYEAGAPAPAGQRVRYTVAFEDPGTEFASPLCQPSRAADDRPPASAPAFEWHWHARLVRPGEVSVQLQKKPSIGGMAPYLLVVESHGERQYLYPHNARGYQGHRFSQRYHLPPGKATEDLKVKAYLADGTIKEGSVRIDYGRSKPPREYDAAELEKHRSEARREFDRGLSARYWNGAGNVVSGHKRMQTWVWAKAERDRAHTRALEKLRALFGALTAEDQTRFRSTYEQYLDRLQTQRMALLCSRGEMAECLALLDERHAAGKTHPREYVRAAEALIRHHNDTTRAHAVWKKLQERLPTWAAGLTEEDLNRSPSLKRDARSYPKLAQKDLCYPVPPLKAK